MEIANAFEILKWVVVVLVAPLFGWLGGIFAISRTAKRRKKARINFLRGLPPEAKAVLVNFHQQGAHTHRGDPGTPAVLLLVSQGVLQVGPGGGSYDAIDSYLTVHADFWKVMDDWISAEIEAGQFH